eukprot:CAMPEP_0202886736 /NCGR_PEP_ID=MMETSP1391-20130828/42324_1 /ASSEMBLY_ACC=CAM_ASM_000867 /TAXON_ID=1034604 /ORGANISM="Chlamydomonas leiostraca, Strain SAG 11-49" /LENGTH=112 /DNA_ID=CAMNT_0049570011 /DNA_START=1800 /DNA_END=2138 /DNA_ORIENTATION=-
MHVTGLTNLSDVNFVHYLVSQLHKRWHTFIAALPNDAKADVLDENVLGRVHIGRSVAAPADLVTTFVADNIHWAKQRVMIRMAQRFFSDGSCKEDEDDPDSEPSPGGDTCVL